MQTIFFPKETYEFERRAAATPRSVQQLKSLGLKIYVQSGIGSNIGISDSAYVASGAEIVKSFSEGAQNADIIIRVKCSLEKEISCMKQGSFHISLFDVAHNENILNAFNGNSVHAVSLEMVPRSSVAQKFDVLSSQSNLAGYAAVLESANHIDKIFPMMMTPAGTVSPVNVFVIGVGVAGLQAIATAKRLGARVEAFDTRPEVEEQVRSVGAKFLKINIGETGRTEQGYAKELTQEQIEKQHAGMISACQKADVVITTAKVFGRKAPVLITHEMLAKITTKTLFVDMAVMTGGNVEGSIPGKCIEYNSNVSILGLSEPEQAVADTASQLFAENIYNFINHFYNKTESAIVFDRNDDIISRCLVA